MAKLSIGDRAPDVSFIDDNGREIALYDFLKKGPTLFVFYPGDFTMVCTKQLCDYRDHFSEFTDLGVQIVGVSHDSVETHESFRKTHRFPFPLVADPHNQAAKALGCTSPVLLGLPSRGLFLVDRAGTLRYRFVELVPLSRRGSEEVVHALKSMKASGIL